MVENTITDATDITMYLFVLTYETDAYDRVATVHDIENYPEEKTLGIPWYRAVAASKDFDNITDATEFADYVKVRLERVVQQYEEYTGEFEGEEDTIIPS